MALDISNCNCVQVSHGQRQSLNVELHEESEYYVEEEKNFHSEHGTELSWALLGHAEDCIPSVDKGTYEAQNDVNWPFDHEQRSVSSNDD